MAVNLPGPQIIAAAAAANTTSRRLGFFVFIAAAFLPD
jgi:hypothetical protein